MPSFPERVAEARIAPRLTLPAAYTLVRVKPAGTDRYRWTGHIYDISLSGMRFELDAPLPPGSEVEVRGMLPGSNHTTFRATGRVVRIHDGHDADGGPSRMAMMFNKFQTSIDQRRLMDYLDSRGLSRPIETVETTEEVPLRRAA